MVKVLLLRIDHPGGALFSFFFLAVCILDVSGYLVGAEARCNWYLGN
jgi:hypothetical protein